MRLFAMGLLFLLFREHGTLLVGLYPSAEGETQVRIVGTTTLSARTALEGAVAELPARPAPDATTAR